jgi:hypothetical protein
VFSTPFAETRPFPEAISLAIAQLATRVDPGLERLLAVPLARRLAWNVVVVGTKKPAVPGAPCSPTSKA